ncbi:hypothetical protein VNO78_02691 [Psophocarpus tetragonolobus]|uniref:Oleosin n=1 Tax=Psophocarpus tetragonolobus TaxID=3891 RepID=A0AAN9XVC9_PSOTE
MADHHLLLPQPPRPTAAPPPLLRKVRHHASNSGQLFGLLTLLLTGSILLLLTGLTLVGLLLGLVLFAPLIIVTSPIWIPLAALAFLVTAAFLSTCGFALVVVALFTWLYRYLKRPLGQPAGPNRFKHALNRLKDRKLVLIDAAPGA